MLNRILVLNNHGLGDVVMSLPFFRGLLKDEPQARVLVLFKTNLEKDLFKLTGLFQNNVERFELFSVDEIPRLARFFCRVDKAFSLGIGGRKAKIFFAIMGIRNYVLAHPYKYEESFRTYERNNQHRWHKKVLYLSLLNMPDDVVHLQEEGGGEFKFDADFERCGSRYVVVAVGSGEVERHKRWSVDGYRELVVNVLKHTPFEIMFVGSREEQVIVDQILAGLDDSQLIRIRQNNGKTTLKELLVFLRDGAVVIGGDSGVLHMAAACNTPVLGLFGPTDYLITGPTGDRVQIVTIELPCSPCYAKGKSILGCGYNACMENIEVSTVFRRLLAMIE